MRTWYINSILIFVILAGFSCKKKKYPPELTLENGVVFYSIFTVDGHPQKLEGGSNYYMYSSFVKDSSNVLNFIGDLKQVNCQANCANSLRIQINDYKALAAGASVNIDSSLQAKKYEYLKGSVETRYTVNFSPSFNKNAASYKWDFGDGFTSNLVSPSHTYKRSGKYNVCLTITSQNGCYSSVCNVLNLKTNNPLKSNILLASNSGNLLSFSQNTLGGKAPYKFLWNFGDGKTDSLANPTHYYSIAGAYPIVLRIIDQNKDTVFVNYNASTASDGSSCSANYKESSITYTPYDFALSKVIITWVDENGVSYTSKNPLQSVSSFFEIVSVENYENNENGQATKKLHIKFKCNVYNGTKVRAIDNGEAFICVAYK